MGWLDLLIDRDRVYSLFLVSSYGTDEFLSCSRHTLMSPPQLTAEKCRRMLALNPPCVDGWVVECIR